MVIEELRFAVEPGDRAGFLAVEEQVWTEFLRTVPGFLRKEVWVPSDHSSSVVVMIWWESMEHWKAVTPEQCAEVDARMGTWLREITRAVAYDVVRADGPE
jgi:uncharacterized protein (TIGR03792 family)